jgi:NAD(P)-dependent dehydrogenase (short-subunit alcohol dehydrogenase family)
MSYNPFSLKGKTILITGASSGIGRATAVECSRMGAQLFLTGRNEQRLIETMELLDGKDHSYIPADLTEDNDMQHLIASLPPLDGLVNNAGIQKYMPTQFITEEDLLRILKTNTIAPILLTRTLVKKKKMKNPSSVVFTSSIAGNFKCSPGNAMYSTSKGAISGFMRNSAIDLAAKGIRCNAVNPGMIVTPIMTENSALTEEQWEENRKLYPLKRFGKPEDVAFAIIYLLSDASSWVTGSSLIIDGGRIL